MMLITRTGSSSIAPVWFPHPAGQLGWQQEMLRHPQGLLQWEGVSSGMSH